MSKAKDKAVLQHIVKQVLLICSENYHLCDTITDKDILAKANACGRGSANSVEAAGCDIKKLLDDIVGQS